MDTRNGRIYPSWDDIPERDRSFCEPMAVPPTELQRATLKVKRGDPCPCGSKKKFKRCCMMRVARGEGLKPAPAGLILSP